MYMSDESIKFTFEKELTTLLNRYNKENGSNTPDFILARYMSECLASFNNAVYERAKWYGRIDVPGQGSCELVTDDHVK
jgi:hypothetical protein